MKTLCVIALALATSAVQAATPPGTSVFVSDVKAVSDMTREELVKENLALKKENQALRRELVRQQGGEPKIDLSKVREQKGVAGDETNGKAMDDGGYWLTSDKQRRHNSKCKYYKLGRGRPCQKNEGTPCKRCGG